eukprot:5935430-Heterocapsa_arctica.AAC.1
MTRGRATKQTGAECRACPQTGSVQGMPVEGMQARNQSRTPARLTGRAAPSARLQPLGPTR